MSVINNITAPEQNYHLYPKEKSRQSKEPDFHLSAQDDSSPSADSDHKTGSDSTHTPKTEKASTQDLYAAQCRMSQPGRYIPDGRTPETAIGIGVRELDDTGSHALHIYETGELACVDVQGREQWKLHLSDEQYDKVDELLSSFKEELSLLGRDLDFWKFYADSEADPQSLLDTLQRTDEKTLHSAILSQMPSHIKAAWETAASQAGTDGFGFVSGQFIYLSELGKKYLEASLSGKESDFPGNSTESVLSFARQALDSLNEALKVQNTDRIHILKSKEKAFYETLIGLLEP